MWGTTCVVDTLGNCAGGTQTHYWRPTASCGVPRRLPVTSDLSGSDELFCAGHVGLDDGTVFTAGGTDVEACSPDPNHPHGLKKTWVFDPASSDTCGQRAPTLNHCGQAVDQGWRRGETGNSMFERWYPTCTLLPNGRVLVTSGGSCNAFTAEIPELYDRLATSNAFAPLDSAASGRYPGPWYPFVFSLKDSKVLHVGPFLSANVPPAYMQKLTPVVGATWQNSSGTSGVRGGSAVMYTTRDPRNGQALMLKAGGLLSGSPLSPEIVSSIEVVRDDGTASVSSATMATPRINHNLTVLPNGKVLITGGNCAPQGLTTQAVYIAELWDPANPNSAPVRLADMPNATDGTRARTYHSGALLLPDGRVLSGGGETCTAITPEGECFGPVHSETGDYFNPPYLYTSGNVRISDATDRPQVSGEPSFVATGNSFTLSVSAGSGNYLAQACLIRPGAVTHAFNQDQRYVPLTFTPSGPGSGAGAATRTVTAPLSADEVPPGYYMLFFLNDLGYPSIGKFVRVWGVLGSSNQYVGMKFCQNCVSSAAKSS